MQFLNTGALVSGRWDDAISYNIFICEKVFLPILET